MAGKRNRSRGRVQIVSEFTSTPVLGVEAEVRAAQLAASMHTTTDARYLAGDSPCRACGGRVHRADAVTFGTWRVHPGCPSAWPPDRLRAAAKALLGEQVSVEDAVVITEHALVVHNFHTQHPEPTWLDGEVPGVPWGHVDAVALRAAVQDLPGLRAAAGLEPVRCTSGACAWCGTVESRSWHDEQHAWPDGSPAPLCEPCDAVYVKHGSPSPAYWGEQRDALGEAVTGSPAMTGEHAPGGLVGFAESDREDRTGGEAWSHLDPAALRAYRFDVWSRYGLAYCPPEQREQVAEWADRRDRMRALRVRAKASAEAAKADMYGFGSS
jgi:hypothetical protein